MEDKLFDLMTKMYNEMQGMKIEMQDIKQTVDSMDQKLDEKADKQDLLRLEHKLLDKVNALFDAREIQIDHETAMAKDIKSVQDTVEKIELKLIRNN